MGLNLDTADHRASSTQQTKFERKRQPFSQRAPPQRRSYSAISHNQSDSGDQEDPQLRFTVYIIDKPVSTCNYSFTISANATISDFQSNLLKALNIRPSSGTVPISDLWLLNHENTSFKSTLDNNTAFIPKRILMEHSDRFAQKIDSSSFATDSTISSCLSRLSSATANSNGSNTGNTYLVAVELMKDSAFRSSAQSSRPSPFTARARTAAPLTRHTLGLHGLQNLGNTCYMNSALQCLSNTPQLTRYFLSGEYRRDLNTSNALGLDGDLAEAYAKLLRDIWTPSTSFSTRRVGSISPEKFKSTFERFNPHFVGYLQQDSQELLGFLLDGLHEDLNRVLEKPYIEIPDFDDHIRNEEIADKFWSYHKSRNDSIIVDLFQGQYKSRLVCGECKKVSITFDPFMYISLPLPVGKCEINVVYVPYLPSHRQLAIKIQLEREATIKELKQQVEKSVAASPSLAIQDGHSAIADRIRSIRPSDTIHVYELPCPSTEQDDEDWIVFPVYCSTTLDQQASLSAVVSIPQFGLPIVLAVKAEKLKDTSYLYNTIISHMERYCIPKLFEEVKSPSLSPSVPDTTAADADVLSYVQQPIHTAAAVIPAGGRPMVPMPNLFKIQVFEYKNSPESFTFPVGESQIHWYDNTQESLKQGRGVLIEWTAVKAQQFFGTTPSTNEINPEAWYDYDQDEQSASTDSHTSSGYNTRYGNSSNRESRVITLSDCLDEFTGDEHLDDQDSWYCPRCKKHQRALKKMDIWKLPEIIVVHLKRFSQVRHWRNKVDTMIDFPLKELDMTDRVLGHQDESLIYDLYAVDNHYGGMGGGHYTAFAQNIDDGEWYEFNDSSVTAMSDKDVKTSAAYLLFYKRRS
ncbi:ubiquitin carboxyl-terminal hydrolase 4-like [Mucor ambiguus]|uniref:Ubiquitin carboxyl-terminal hydrolase n=1 Tax=Mucor ambiguus TaxID=91626 RepID=A0A0C9MWW0_9FUNG|nr:ubiquitin carboxyl-terminal hydrolase 4-like [Mucor ambiguus]